MAESEKLIYSIRELFSEFLRGRKFNIPSYQRGYKWTPDNVVTLLNDLKKFNPSENDFTVSRILRSRMEMATN